MENNILENTKLRRELFEMQGVFNRYPKSRLDALREVFKSIDKVGNDELKVILKTALRNTSDYKKTTALMEETIRLENGLNK
jgi:hypothetical protein